MLIETRAGVIRFHLTRPGIPVVLAATDVFAR